MTRKYVDMFKQGIVPPPPKTPYTGAEAVSTTLGADDAAKGLERLDAADGESVPTIIDGKPARKPTTGVSAGRYLYFRVDDGFKTPPPMRVTVEVDYYDAAPGALVLQYDSTDGKATMGGAYKNARAERLSGSRAWRTARFDVSDARFGGVQNAGADFRIAFEGVEPPVAAVRVLRGDR